MFRNFISIIAVIAFFAGPGFADEPHKLEKIVVTPSRMETPAGESGRSVTVLDEDALAYSSYAAIPDAIGDIGGIDIRRRSPQGVQADINIRGATFEENSVLIDGVKINDPQTGHYSMDLPVTASDIERIEILKGPASSLYGANSFGGVINIITKRPKRELVTASAEGGSHDYFNTAASVSAPFGVFANRFSVEESRSTGYIPETEFNIFSLADTLSADTTLGAYDLFFGYTKKDFGAGSFYSNLYNNEEEHTDTRFFKLAGDAESGPLKIRPRLFLKRHFDKFALDRNRPGWQTNYHTSYTKGGELNFILENGFADTSYGVEVSRDSINSTNIQTHKRDRQGFYAEVSPHLLDKLYLNIGLREDHFSDFGWETSPSVSASYAVTENIRARTSVGRAYRVPTFTDLYYGDSANLGNSGLKPESAWSYEAGADLKVAFTDLAVTYFHRDTLDTIDWTRASPANRWQATNIGTIDTNGVEASFILTPKDIYRSFPVEKLFIDYTGLDQFRKHDFLSKYALDYLKQHITGGIDIDIFGFKNYWVLNYKKRIGDSGFIVVDTKITKDIVKRDKLVLQAFLGVENLFDVDYSEQSDVPMPGRWIKSGARVEF